MACFRALAITAFFLKILFWSAAACSEQNCEVAERFYKQAVETFDYKEKIVLYKKAINLCQGYAESHNNLADAYEHTGKYDEAILEYKKAIKLDHSLSYAFFGLGDTCFKIGLYNKAIDAYTAGLKLKPDDRLAQKGLKEAAKMHSGTIHSEGIMDSAAIVSKLGASSIQLMGPGGIRQRSSRIRFNNILFDLNSNLIKPSSVAQLSEIGAALADDKLKGQIFLIEGHTDSLGTEKFNLVLSRKRAQSVLNYLLNYFPLSKDKFKVAGHGENRPVCDNSTLEGRMMNRRVEIIAFSK